MVFIKQFEIAVWEDSIPKVYSGIDPSERFWNYLVFSGAEIAPSLVFQFEFSTISSPSGGFQQPRF